jgi:hypothetical protein
MNPVPTNLWEWLAPIDADERFALCVAAITVGLTALVVIIAVAAHTLSRIHRARLEHTFKRELLERGLTADEIAQIVEATAARKWLRPMFRRGSCTKERDHVYAS